MRLVCSGSGLVLLLRILQMVESDPGNEWKSRSRPRKVRQSRQSKAKQCKGMDRREGFPSVAAYSTEC